jgi:hypothetical protein
VRHPSLDVVAIAYAEAHRVKAGATLGGLRVDPQLENALTRELLDRIPDSPASDQRSTVPGGAHHRTA